VVVGLDDVESAELIGEMRLGGAIGERAVAVVVEIVQWLAHVHAGRNDVEKAVVVEVVDDHTAGHGEGTHASGGSNVLEATNIFAGLKQFRIEKILRRD